MYMEEIKIKVFVDNVGRTVIGKLVSEDKNYVVLNNPCTIFVQPNEQGQLQVQTIPMFFKEFLTLDGREQGTNFTFNQSNIVNSNAGDILDSKLITQYNQVVSNFVAPDVAASDSSDTEVVKLFND